MNTRASIKFGTRMLMLTTLMFGWQAASAAVLMELRGDAVDVKKDTDARVRLSLLGLSDETQSQAVAQAFKDYLGNKDSAAFEKALLGQETKGYLFTTEAAGYTVKYAWQDQNDADRLMVVVTPGLKIRNPYMWKTPNTMPEPFSVLELRRDGDTYTVKSSLDSPVEVNGDGQLQLQNYDSAKTFATMRREDAYNVTNPIN